MKLFKKVLGLILVVGIIIGGIWGIGRQRDKKGLEGQAGQEIAGKPLKFAVMSDIHSDWENFRKALGKTKVDMGVRPSFAEASAGKGFVIITGDLTTLGKKSELTEAKKILDASGLRYYVIPGNHDIWWGRKFKEDIWSEVFGKSFLSFRDNGVKFILINNADSEGGFEGFGVRQLADGGQKFWLKKEAEECLRIYCLVFAHMPLNHPNSLHVMGEDNPKVASEAGEIREILGKYGATEIFAGHLHFSSSYELGGLKTTIIGAVSSDRNVQSPKFVEILWNNGKIVRTDIFIPN